VAVLWGFHGKGISPSGFQQDYRETVQGRVENISRTGVCIVTKKPLEKSAILHCEISPDGFRVGIPTLLEVRWLQPEPEGDGTRAGLRFLV